MAGDLEDRLAARANATPSPGLRGRVLEALENERRAERRTWFTMAAAAWVVVLGVAWGSPPAHVDTPERSVLEELARGPDLSLVPRLARPIGPLGDFSP